MTGFLDAPPPPAAIIITEDRGGVVDKYYRAAYVYRTQKRRVEIRGSCRSACILALSVPNVCVAPEGLVKAHQAYDQKTGLIRPEITKQMLDRLPKQVRSALDGKIETHYSPQGTLDYNKLRSAGIPKCDDEPNYQSSTKDGLINNGNLLQGPSNVKTAAITPFDVMWRIIRIFMNRMHAA